MRRATFCFSATVLCSACAGHGPAAPHETEFNPPRTILEHYDSNRDGTVTRTEMEQGLHAEFTAADVRHTGCLDEDEARLVNDKRWQSDQSTASPLVDFKGLGCIDFDEFAATPRSLFEQMDLNEDGKVDSDELHPHGGGRHEP